MELNLLKILGTVEDPREFNGKEYELKYILLFTIFAIAARATTYVDIARFIQSQIEKLRAMFKLKWRRTPTHSCVYKILTRVSVDDIERAFREHAAQNVKLVGHKHYCFDGKTLRGSKSNVDQKPSARIFELFESIGEIVLAHIPLDSNKDHELQALEEFLQSLELCGITVTADALHCQKKTLN
jgi:hypothetical protein